VKALIQRVKRAEVLVDGASVGKIERGILTLLGVMKGDTEEQMRKLLTKIAELRIFEDEQGQGQGQGKMNRSLLDVKGGHLVVSQFTLAADTSAGRRPSFTGAESPELARAMYEKALEFSRTLGLETQSGSFGATMEVSLVNDGPATFLLEA
jgi:D-aminoacyl-tRNA deacylase